MTKEEALAPHIKMSDAFTSWVYAEDAKKAMDVYAKQNALAFANWTSTEGYFACGEKPEIWKNFAPNCDIVYSTQELYALFIEQQTKQ